MHQPAAPKPCRVSLVIDIETSATIALTLARAHLADVIAKLHKHGITATPVRVEIENYPNTNP